jgi:hypothetical protein
MGDFVVGSSHPRKRDLRPGRGDMLCFSFPKAIETEEMLICYSPQFPLPIVGEGKGEGDFTGLINEK